MATTLVDGALRPTTRGIGRCPRVLVVHPGGPPDRMGMARSPGGRRPAECGRSYSRVRRGTNRCPLDRSRQSVVGRRGLPAFASAGARSPCGCGRVGLAFRVTAASDSGLSTAALLGGNVGTARVWVAEVLGPLASHTENDERLRETLRVFLRAGSSFKAAAKELHLHSNSVKYRVQRAIERRGRPISDGRLDVEVALLLCHWYGSAVLTVPT